MHTSLFDLFKIGIGPSSSHTVGPMRAAYHFAERLAQTGMLENVTRVRIELYGSLALTGKGHGTDRGILLGLMGERPDTVDPASVTSRIAAVAQNGELVLFGRRTVPFHASEDLLFRVTETLAAHPNGMRFTAFSANEEVIDQRIYYSIGGGFIREEGQAQSSDDRSGVPHSYTSSAELLEIGEREGLKIHEIVFANELTWRSAEAIRGGIHKIWGVMCASIARGLETEGILPGGLKVRRRAPGLARRLQAKAAADPLSGMDWLNVFAIAVNEENAAGGRVVTAPTNGAAGVIPSVAQYYLKFLGGDAAGIERFFLSAAAIGTLYKENASISGAEVGCQGEVGVACSMAAGGLVAALEGANAQVEHAAEIGMEHNLGMTCDPIGGLVQIPCIERNAFGAVKAVNAARMAMQDPAEHKVSLDQVIRTMYQTGLDMQSRYKETSLAGLAVNVIEC
ncbi:MAG: L-serine ammonia-lyase [Bryobacteraceae bacterium]